MNRIKVASVIPSFYSGGVGTVCTYTVQALSRHPEWDITLVSLHDPESAISNWKDGVKRVSLGLKEHCPHRFLEWHNNDPQDLIITSDVSQIEDAFPYLPAKTRHIVQIHDSIGRYRAVALRNQQWIDGVACVGRHIEAQLRDSLDSVNFRGLLSTIHNGAEYPPLKPRRNSQSELRLLYLGRLDPLKGVFDLVPILNELRSRGVPFNLTIVGGKCEELSNELRRKRLDKFVVWEGYVPHQVCYDIAANSDILMMTSRREPFGMVTIEAMSMGCVPIAYNTPSGSTEIIEHGKSGVLVPLGNYSQWASEVETLHLNRSQLISLSKGAVMRAREDFSAEKMANRLALFAEQVLLNSHVSPALRLPGLPPVRPSEQAHNKPLYQFIPARLRRLMRKQLHSHPSLSYWLLSR